MAEPAEELYNRAAYPGKRAAST